MKLEVSVLGKIILPLLTTLDGYSYVNAIYR